MVIKKVTVKFDSCAECPVLRYSGCYVYNQAVGGGIPDACPIDESVMMNRYTDFKSNGTAVSSSIIMGRIKTTGAKKEDPPAYDADGVLIWKNSPQTGTD